MNAHFYEHFYEHIRGHVQGLVNRLALKRLASWAVLVAGGCIGVAIAAQDIQPDDFAWRGTLALPAGASVARVEVPVDALMRLQTSAAHDLRVFNASGAVVPFAVLGVQDVALPAAAALSKPYKAYSLFSTDAKGGTAKPAAGAVHVQVDTAGASQGSAWVRWDSATGTEKNAGRAAGAAALPAAVFDTRGQAGAWSGVEVKAELPRNALVHMAVASSTDLKTWSPVSVAGPLFRFDGADAPGNTVLEFAQPVALKGRYLRLTWEGYEGVVVASVTGRMASTQAVVVPVRAALPAGTAQDQGLVWSLGFATPMAALHLQATQNNTLVPVRIQGRNDASQAWRTLAPAVLYRLDTVGPGGSRNAPTPLYSAQGASVRWLRVETTNGTPLLPQDVQVTAEFAPVQLAFLASGAEPFTLALGRAQTPAGAMDASLIGAVLGGNSASTWAKLPIARISSVQQAADAGGGMGSGPVGALVARFGLRSIWLWTVLVVGVLVLGAVAFSLVRQLGAGPNTPP